GDLVQLPAVALKGELWAEVDFTMPSEHSALVLTLAGPARNTLAVRVGGGHKLLVQNALTFAGKGAWKPRDQGTPLRSQRTARGVELILNEVRLGTVPLQAAPGDYNTALLGFDIKTKDDKSPRVHGVRVVPVP